MDGNQNHHYYQIHALPQILVGITSFYDGRTSIPQPEFGSIFLREPQLPKNNRKNNRDTHPSLLVLCSGRLAVWASISSSMWGLDSTSDLDPTPTNTVPGTQQGTNVGCPIYQAIYR